MSFNTPSTFAAVPIGGQFIEALTTCNEVVTRIEPEAYGEKTINARRAGGKFIFMAEWEPVFIKNPIRVQRKRSKGWRMPLNTVYVGRPTQWGNPFDWTVFKSDNGVTEIEAKRYATSHFEKWLNTGEWREFAFLENFSPMDLAEIRQNILAHIHELSDKNLACWCKLGQPCHADVLLRLANE